MGGLSFAPSYSIGRYMTLIKESETVRKLGERRDS